MQQGWGLLEESGHLGVVVYRALDRQEAPVQFVNQTHVHNIAERSREEEKQNIWWSLGLMFLYYLGEKIKSHRQTKTFSVHTSTALQLKTDTSPKPSNPSPCYYCDISNLSWPMTGLMIMFPVLFQPQITANSVIRGLLCQPSSGPLTICWPGGVRGNGGSVFSKLQYARTWRAQLKKNTRQLTETLRGLRRPIRTF